MNMKTFHEWINTLNGPLWEILVFVLIGVGLFYTVSTGFVQVRLFVQSMREMKSGRQSGDDAHGITPFQAFVTGLASRVGVGNIAGVAIAVAVGGAGAVFWMWLTAFIGMSSAFAESSLAQLFKIRDHDNAQFRGGPAYYITNGLKQRWLGVLFALALILAYGFVFNAVQANSIIAAVNRVWGWDRADFSIGAFYVSWVGLGLVILTALNIFGGIRRISKVAEAMVPLMAFLYLLMALYIMLVNISVVPAVFATIFREAFAFKAAAGGVFGAMISQAMMLGIKRGLFSNEAGMGSAPNAAAASDVKHPVNQGLIQMLGVFVDTFIVCSCTAVILLVSGAHLDSSLTGVQLTQLAIESQVGVWGGSFLAVVLFLFAFSSIIGNYAYAESNVQFIKSNKTVLLWFRLAVLAMVYFGAVNSVPLVWDMADLSMGIMAMINLIAILLLSPLVWVLLKDYRAQLKAGQTPQFKLEDHPQLREKIDSDIW